MSYTQQQAQASNVDTYLLSQTAPTQPLDLDPKYLTIRMITPIGRLSYIHLKEPKAIEEGKEPKFSATLLMNPAATGDLWKAIVAVANARWPAEDIPNPNNPQQMVRVNGEQLLSIGQQFPHLSAIALHSPLRNGDHVYAQKPQQHSMYQGTFTINASSGTKNPPVFYGPGTNLISPDSIYSGDYARLFVTVYAFPKVGEKGFGKKGISILLNGVQFAKRGERIGGYDAHAAAAKAFAIGGPLPVEVPDDGFGFNPGGSPFGGGGVGGFATTPASGVPAAPGYGPVAGGAPSNFAAAPQGGAATGGAPVWNPPQNFSPPG